MTAIFPFDPVSKRKRDRHYPAFPSGDEYRQPEMVDPHTKWSPKVTVVDDAEMQRRAEALKLRGPIPDDPYRLEET